MTRKELKYGTKHCEAFSLATRPCPTVATPDVVSVIRKRVALLPGGTLKLV